MHPPAHRRVRAWSWQASRHGGAGPLIDPATGTPRPAGQVVAGLLGRLAPVLSEYGELAAVESAVGEMLGDGAGFLRQRAAFARRGQMNDVVALALEATHRPMSAEPAR